MALSNSDLSDLLDAIRVGEGVDLIREIARWVLQELIEAEAVEAIGAGRYERVEGRVTERNGHREGDPFGGPVAMRLGVGGSWSTVGRTRWG